MASKILDICLIDMKMNLKISDICLMNMKTNDLHLNQ